MKRLILALALTLAFVPGCNAQEGFYPDPNQPVLEATVHDPTWINVLNGARMTVRDAWEQENGKYICYINEYGMGEGYHLRASRDDDGGLVLIYNYQNSGTLYPRTCYEGVRSDGSSVAVGTCTNKRVFLDQIDYFVENYDRWAISYYHEQDSWQQWSITLDTGERLYVAFPTVDALVFPCDRPPYWEAPEPRLPTKRQLSSETGRGEQ